MKKVLIITYYFPPSGGPGVQRVLKHIKYLREFGWQPYVLTVSNGQYPAIDESLIGQIPKDVVVERTKIYEPYDIYRLLTGKKKGSAIDVNVIKKDDHKMPFMEKIAEFIRATFFIPDARIGWLPTAVPKAIEMIEKYNIDAIYSSSPPYTCSIVAKKVKNILKNKGKNIPWIAGFRDPWTGFISSPKRWSLPGKIDKKMEYDTFNESDFVECAWEGIIKDAIGKYPNLDKNKFIHIPNGFDSSDIPLIDAEVVKKNQEQDIFTLTYTGSMYGRRNPQALFDAVENLINTNIIDKKKIKLRFVGRFGNEVLDMINETSFKDSIELVGYVTHEKSIEYLLTSDALLLVVDESKESAEIVPGKVYEYMGVYKPLFTIAPEDGAIAKLVRETNSGLIAHQTNIKGIESIFEKYYNAKMNKENLISPNIDAIKQYERRNSAKQLAALLDSIT